MLARRRLRQRAADELDLEVIERAAAELERLPAALGRVFEPLQCDEPSMPPTVRSAAGAPGA